VGWHSGGGSAPLSNKVSLALGLGGDVEKLVELLLFRDGCDLLNLYVLFRCDLLTCSTSGCSGADETKGTSL
jgi:hypothetical protein